MKGLQFLFFCWLLAVTGFPSVVLAATPISQPVGEVNGHIVTSREVQLNYLIERALLLSPSQFRSENHQLDPASSKFRRELNGVFIEWVVDLQASAMVFGEVSAQDLERAIAAVGVIEKSSIWRRVRANPEEIREVVLRKMRAKRFIQQKEESSRVEPTDEEVRQFYEDNRERFPFPFEERVEQLRRAKRRQDADRRFQAWLRNLQRQYKVRSYLAP